MSTALTYKDVVELYVAMFQRAPEKEGADFWYNQAVNQKLSKAQLATAMFRAAVNAVSTNASYKTYYPQYDGINPANITMEQARNIIDSMYRILFNKSYLEDPNGVDYWAGLIANQKMDIGVVINGMINSAKSLTNSQDTDTRNAALSFVNKVQAAEEIAKIVQTFDGDFSKYQDYIKGVNQNNQTIITAIQNATTDYINSLQSQFTTNADTVTGTINDDLFFAKAGTLNNGDIVNGGAGYDRLIAELNTGTAVTPTIRYIEDITVISKNDSANLDLSNQNNAGTISRLKLDVTSNSGTISGISSANTELVVTGSNSATFSYRQNALSGNSDSVKLVLENANSNITLNPNSGENIETLNVVSRLGANRLNIQQGGSDSGFRNINITGDAAVSGGTLKAESGQNFTLNMSGLNNRITGLTVNLNGSRNVTITGSDYDGPGSGNDENLTLSGNATRNITVSTGKGEDRVQVGSTGSTGSTSAISYGDSANKNSTVKFLLGDGNDTMEVVQNLTVYGNLEIDLGAGNNTFTTRQQNQGQAQPTIYKIKLDGATNFGNLTVKAGSGRDSVTLDTGDATTSAHGVSGNINIDLGDGGTANNSQTLTLVLGNDNGGNRAVNGGLTVKAGSGVDQITIQGTTTANATSTINGKTSIDAGGGDNTITFDGNIKFGNDATITTGSGKDKIEFKQTSSQSPQPQIDLNGKKLTISTGAGDDTVDLSELKNAGTVEIDAGGADTKDTITLSGTSLNIRETIVINKSYTGYVDVKNFSTENGKEDSIKLTGFSGLSINTGTDIDIFSVNAPSGVSDYTNAQEVLQKLNNTAAKSGNTYVGSDDNILVIKVGTTTSYIYYYKDTNANEIIDTNDTLKLLAIVDKDITSNITQLFTV